MEISNKAFPNNSFLEIKLDRHIVDYLWEVIIQGKKKKEEYKSRLIGNISHSYGLIDANEYFYKNVCIKLVKQYRKKNGGLDPFQSNMIVNSKTPLMLEEFWVNYQYQAEFNPYHSHGGVYSFVIWMRIPYSVKDQLELPQFYGTKRVNLKAGTFEFEYIDLLGNIRNIKYVLSPEYEGTMLFFPAALRHCVYPFYGTEEPRVSISGNLWFVPVDQ